MAREAADRLDCTRPSDVSGAAGATDDDRSPSIDIRHQEQSLDPYLDDPMEVALARDGDHRVPDAVEAVKITPSMPQTINIAAFRGTKRQQLCSQQPHGGGFSRAAFSAQRDDFVFVYHLRIDVGGINADG